MEHHMDVLAAELVADGPADESSRGDGTKKDEEVELRRSATET